MCCLTIAKVLTRIAQICKKFVGNRFGAFGNGLEAEQDGSRSFSEDSLGDGPRDERMDGRGRIIGVAAFSLHDERRVGIFAAGRTEIGLADGHMIDAEESLVRAIGSVDGSDTSRLSRQKVNKNHQN